LSLCNGITLLKNQFLRTQLFVKVRNPGGRDLFGCGMKLSLVTTSLSTQIKVEAISLSSLPKDTTSELAGLLHTIPFYVERQAGKL